uniref:Uncharacterized protein n=1 Tax=Timema shepardi TaxID=629360 RepID=A0A7R9B9B1_TIMSH|nr:unnamed protein product [Timema shepardi]
MLSSTAEDGEIKVRISVGSGDITFHYQTGELNQFPVMKLVPWFLDVNKKICAICFSPDANWLVVIAHDGSIHIVPALPLVDTTASFDHRWSISDITSFPPPYLGSTVTPRPKQGWPTSIVWWQSAQEYHQTVIVGNDLGEIRFFSLTSEKQVGITYVKAAILSLHICEDNTLETVFLLELSQMARADHVRYKRHGGIQQATAHARRSEERNRGGGHDPLALLLNPALPIIHLG